MIVRIDLMSYIAIMNVQTISSNVTVMVNAYWAHTNVMVFVNIVLMDLMKPKKFVVSTNVYDKESHQ